MLAEALALRNDQPMCLICLEFDKNAMSVVEARRALGEMRVAMDDDHAKAVEEKLEAAEADAALANTP